MAVDVGCFTVELGTKEPTVSASIDLLCINVSAEAGGSITPPVMTGYTDPPQNTDKVLISKVYLPFDSVTDNNKDTNWKYTNSPFYTLARYDNYSCLYTSNNTGSGIMTYSQQYSYGVTKTVSDTFSVSTGISVTASLGVDVGLYDASVSATVSVELGYSSSTSVSQMETRTETISYACPGNTAFALYIVNTSLILIRGDGTVAAAPLQFNPPSNYVAQYPVNNKQVTAKKVA